ncbi:hypothetical protein SK128_010564 [Halocaridina rubra]|uniref:CRIB domain-containing protein n=1 Tax=Halocaridina rubra TaxID=373956 RepID=A0AAN8WBQ7_HALRR
MSSKWKFGFNISCIGKGRESTLPNGRISSVDSTEREPTKIGIRHPSLTPEPERKCNRFRKLRRSNSYPMEISLPTNVIHVHHAIYIPATGDFVGLPESMRIQLNTSSITPEKDSQNPQEDGDYDDLPPPRPLSSLQGDYDDLPPPRRLSSLQWDYDDLPPPRPLSNTDADYDDIPPPRPLSNTDVDYDNLPPPRAVSTYYLATRHISTQIHK